MADKSTALQIEIGQRIGICRSRMGESQQQLADALDVTREIIQHWERGSRQIKAGHIVLLAKHFGTSPDYLLGFTSAISADEKARATEEYTGLSLEAIRHIREAMFTLKALGGKVDIPNSFFTSDYFFELITAAERYRITPNKSDVQVQYITLETEQLDINDILRQSAELKMIKVISKMIDEIDRGGNNGKL